MTRGCFESNTSTATPQQQLFVTAVDKETKRGQGNQNSLQMKRRVLPWKKEHVDMNVLCCFGEEGR